MIEGTIPLFDGCRKVVRHLDMLPIELGRCDAALTIAGVVSELDGFPNPKHRGLWSDELLGRLDRELAEFFGRTGEVVLEACSELEQAVMKL